MSFSIASELMHGSPAENLAEAVELFVDKHCDADRTYAFPPRIDRMVAKHGGTIIECDDLPVDGKVVLSDGSAPVIYIRAGLPFRLRQFVLAHELSHILLHKEFGLIAGEKLFSGLWRSSSTDEEEQLADMIASEFLLPSSLIRRAGPGAILPRLSILSDMAGGNVALALSRMAMVLHRNFVAMQVIPEDLIDESGFAEIDAMILVGSGGEVVRCGSPRFSRSVLYSSLERLWRRRGRFGVTSDALCVDAVFEFESKHEGFGHYLAVAHLPGEGWEH